MLKKSITVEFNNEKEVKLVYETLKGLFRTMYAMLDDGDTFEQLDDVCRLFRILNSMSIEHSELLDDLAIDLTEGIPVVFYEDFDADMERVAEDRLVFVGVEFDGWELVVDDISRYSVVDGDVVLLGRNSLFERAWCFMIVDEGDWKNIQACIWSNRRGIWNGVEVTVERWWTLYLEQLLERGVTDERLYELLIELDMDRGESRYQMLDCD
jgi:hypothetical protein